MQELAGGVDVGNDQVCVSQSGAVIVNSYKRGSARVSGESGFREKFIDL